LRDGKIVEEQTMPKTRPIQQVLGNLEFLA